MSINDRNAMFDYGHLQKPAVCVMPCNGKVFVKGSVCEKGW